MNIAIQTFKILELIEKRCRTRNLGNFENILEHTWNIFLLLFAPQNLELFARGIENYLRPETFQRWPASLFFSLIESTIEVGPLTKSCDIFIQLSINAKCFTQLLII